MNNNLVEYTCPNCKHDWAILLGIYTPQRLISKSDKSDKDAYIHIIKDEDGNVVNLSSPDLSSVKCHIREEDASVNLFSGAEENG
ncbi:hypothetical protein LCGC14_1717460, partial [marine sediment metagenome]